MTFKELLKRMFHIHKFYVIKSLRGTASKRIFTRVVARDCPVIMSLSRCDCGKEMVQITDGSDWGNSIEIAYAKVYYPELWED